MTPEQEKAVSEFNRQSDRVRKCPTHAEGATGVEAAYSDAWSQLVRVGLERPLRKKYRR